MALSDKPYYYANICSLHSCNFHICILTLFYFCCFFFFCIHGLQDLGILQGTAVRVELGDATTAADPTGAHTISRSFPHTYGQPLAHFLRATAKVPEAQIITEHPAIRYPSNNFVLCILFIPKITKDFHIREFNSILP